MASSGRPVAAWGFSAFLALQCWRALGKASPSPRGLPKKRGPLTKKGLLEKSALLQEGFPNGPPFWGRGAIEKARPLGGGLPKGPTPRSRQGAFQNGCPGGGGSLFTRAPNRTLGRERPSAKKRALPAIARSRIGWHCSFSTKFTFGGHSFFLDTISLGKINADIPEEKK